MAASHSTGLHSPRSPRGSRDERRAKPSASAAGPSAISADGLARCLASAWAEAEVRARQSVAAHARFSLALLELGAPPAFVACCAQIMQDQIAHARACCELARRFGARDVGHEPLPKGERTPQEDSTSTVLEVVERGCIRAAVAALCTREALEHCEDPATREVLLREQELEAREAQLAWRFVAWALRGGSRELGERVRGAFIEAFSRQSRPAPLGARDRQLLRHGVLSKNQRAALERRLLRSVVRPCMESLLGRAPAASV